MEMVESMANRGFDMTDAEKLLPAGIELAGRKDTAGLRALTAELLALIWSAPRDPASPYWNYEHPETWPDVEAAMPARQNDRYDRALYGLEPKILAGWQGQLPGGSFGTAIEGYHTDRINEVYGTIDRYITAPETVNDDVVYELVLLDVFERSGRGLTSRDLALEWVRQIPFGWSAEWIALHNLADGILPPAQAPGAIPTPIGSARRCGEWSAACWRRVAAGGGTACAPGRCDLPLRQRRLWGDLRRGIDLPGLCGQRPSRSA